MNEKAKKIVVAILTHIIGTALLVFAAIGMMNAGCPDYALYVWVVITGFFLAYGIFGFMLDCQSEREVKEKICK